MPYHDIRSTKEGTKEGVNGNEGENVGEGTKEGLDGNEGGDVGEETKDGKDVSMIMSKLRGPIENEEGHEPEELELEE